MKKRYIVARILTHLLPIEDVENTLNEKAPVGYHLLQIIPNVTEITGYYHWIIWELDEQHHYSAERKK